MRALLLLLAVATQPTGKATDQAPPSPSPLVGPSTPRAVKNRVISFSQKNQASVPEIHLAQGIPTTLILPLNVNETATRLADPQRLIYKPQFFKNTAVLSPKEDLAPGALVPLSIAIEDGTLLSFVLRTVPTDADFQVTIEVQAHNDASPDSVDRLKQLIMQTQSRLDECQSNAAVAGISQIASQVLSQEPQSPIARTFESHPVKGVDKQSHMLVRLQYLYLLFSHSYLLLTVENRDPSRTWMLDRVEMKLSGDPNVQLLKVLSFEMEPKAVAPGEVAKVVVAFDTPAPLSGQKFAVVLLERGGTRHVNLEFEP